MSKVTSKVLTFWFAGANRNLAPTAEHFNKWFMSTPETDREIKDKFESDLELLAKGKFESDTSECKLAKVLLADQFSRNIYRRTAQAFAYDHISLSIAKSFNRLDFPDSPL
ncbi:hypothetical protein FGO68_gene2150 [Halteria grandinella]|uniref:DUF924 domain-containing protein n=1 Tax=Halteria grandinella TaxID=5974 RepID=A0A8J8NNE9_HALGN|nr:hypothetical protein FGO68_gene2150 [Halteria grandinella]